MATLKEFAEYIKKTYPRTKKMFNGKRCDNKLTVDGILYELEEFEKRCAQDEYSSVPQANELLPHVSDMVCPACESDNIKTINIPIKHCNDCHAEWQTDC